MEIRKSKPVRREIFHEINLPKKILVHVIGHNHPLWSRLLLGGAIIIVASLLPEGIKIFRAVGELMAAVGAVPFIESFLAWVERVQKACTNCRK